MVAQGVAIPPFLTNAILVQAPLQLEKLPKVCKPKKVFLLSRNATHFHPTCQKIGKKKGEVLLPRHIFYPLATRKEVYFLGYVEIISRIGSVRNFVSVR